MHAREVLLQPRVLQSAHASTIQAALDNVLPELKDPEMGKMADSVVWIIVSEPVDMASSNLRKRAQTAEVLRPASNVLVSPIAGCSSHILHRVLTIVYNEQQIVGDLHA